MIDYAWQVYLYVPKFIEIMKGLVFEETIVWVHDDMDPWAALSVGFNDNREFVIELTFDSMGNDSPKQHYNKQVIVDQKGTDRLIDQLNTRLTKLPEAFAEEFKYDSGHEGWPECWDEREVFDIYYEILNYLSCLNIHYKIKKSYD